MNSRVIVALDFSELNKVNQFISKVEPTQCYLKVGNGLFVKYGPKLVEALVSKGFKIFLDLKFNDIPHQVALACQAAAELGVWMLNVHALGGRAMMASAREVIDKVHGQKPLLIAVTLLTSLDEEDMQELGLSFSPSEYVQRLAQLAKTAGLDGVVCSADETPILRKHFGEKFCLVTPGIRVLHDDYHDQKRVVTPQQAIELGANYLVIGRSITECAEPSEMLHHINQSILKVKQ